MQFVLPLAVLVLTWLAVWRYFLAQGHSQIIGHIGGVVMGLMAATLALLLATPRQKTEGWPPQEERAAETTPSQEPAPATAQQPSEEKEVIIGSDLFGPDALPESQPSEEKEVMAGTAPAEAGTTIPEPPSEGTEGNPEQPSAEEEKVASPPEKEEPSLKDVPGFLGEWPLQKSPADQKAETLNNAPDQPVATPAPEPPLPPAASKPTPPARQAAVQGPFILRLTATAEQVWVRVTIDGGAQRTVPLKQGQAVTWTAKRRFVLSVDNAGGLRATLNGKTLPRFGPAGQSRQNIVIPS